MSVESNIVIYPILVVIVNCEFSSATSCSLLTCLVTQRERVKLTKYDATIPPNTHLNFHVGIPSSNPFSWNFTKFPESGFGLEAGSLSDQWLAEELRVSPSAGNCGAPPSPCCATSATLTWSSRITEPLPCRYDEDDSRRGVRSEG